MRTIKVLVVDDHNLVREGISQLFEAEMDITVVGSATNGQDAVEKVRELLPDVVLMDIAMPVMNGIEATKEIRALFPSVQVVALSMYDYEDYIREMFSVGAINYVLKTAARHDVIAAIRAAYEGQSFLYPPIANKLISCLARSERQPEENSLELLTQREKEVLRYIAEGYSNQEISSALQLSIRTVQTHRANIMKKLDFHNTAELVRYAIGSGLVKVN